VDFRALRRLTASLAAVRLLGFINDIAALSARSG
jgi:hypothetical protein